MLHNFTEKFIQSIRGDTYTLDPDITQFEIVKLVASRIPCLIRGFFFKPFFKNCGRRLFVGSNTKISIKNRISLGNGVIIGDRVSISGLASAGIDVGDNVTIRDDCVIDTGLLNNIGTSLTIGARVGISQKCFLQVSGDLIIGNDVIIGPNCSIFTENHKYNDNLAPIKNQGVIRAKTIIEEDVWIGSNSTILAGVRVGHGAIIAAGSVVTKDVTSLTVVAGVPASIIRIRTKVAAPS